MKIWNSVEGYARNPPDKSLEGIFCTAKKGGKSELSSYAFLLLLLRQTKGGKKTAKHSLQTSALLLTKRKSVRSVFFVKVEKW